VCSFGTDSEERVVVSLLGSELPIKFFKLPRIRTIESTCEGKMVGRFGHEVVCLLVIGHAGGTLSHGGGARERGTV